MMETKPEYEAQPDGQPEPEPTWAILELFGHQIIAGKIIKVEPFGAPMIRITVPAVDDQPAFSKDFSPSAVYAATYTSPEVAMAVIRQNKFKAITVFTPELDDLPRLQAENKKLLQAVATLSGQEGRYLSDEF